MMDVAESASAFPLRFHAAAPGWIVVRRRARRIFRMRRMRRQLSCAVVSPDRAAAPPGRVRFRSGTPVPDRAFDPGGLVPPVKQIAGRIEAVRAVSDPRGLAPRVKKIVSYPTHSRRSSSPAGRAGRGRRFPCGFLARDLLHPRHEAAGVVSRNSAPTFLKHTRRHFAPSPTGPPFRRVRRQISD